MGVAVLPPAQQGSDSTPVPSRGPGEATTAAWGCDDTNCSQVGDVGTCRRSEQAAAARPGREERGDQERRWLRLVQRRGPFAGGF